MNAAHVLVDAGCYFWHAQLLLVLHHWPNLVENSWMDVEHHPLACTCRRRTKGGTYETAAA